MHFTWPLFKSPQAERVSRLIPPSELDRLSDRDLQDIGYDRYGRPMDVDNFPPCKAVKPAIWLALAVSHMLNR